MIWCAEIGSCHQGSRSLAYELIRKAKWAGATIAKFQLGWTPEAETKYATVPAQVREEGRGSARYIDDWAPDLAKWCADMDIEFMASIWSLEGLEVARSVGMKRYKIAHQMNDKDLIDAIRSDGKEVFWSGGHRGNWQITTQDEYPSYPPVEIPDGIVGYSSHLHGIADALIAVSRGAEYIEKHICMSKYAGFPKDASFALVPEEFRQMVDIGNEIARLK